jgi:hypothetical protein
MHGSAALRPADEQAGEARGVNRAERHGLLWALYFVQGVPFGLQATAVPVLLRERGASLTLVSLAGGLALPWLLKPLWAPLVDGYRRGRMGRRKTWLVPLHALLVMALVATALGGSRSLVVLCALIAAMNLVAATLDIAVDGLAIDLLSEGELGVGNVAQVVGYKLGMLTGGGLVLWGSGHVGFALALGAVAALAFALGVPLWTLREPQPTGEARAAPREWVSVRAIVGQLFAALRTKGGLWLVVVIASYKLGEAMVDTMFKPFVLDAGMTRAEIGLWIGTWGMAFSIAGSALGGLFASRRGIVGAVALAALLRLVPLGGTWWLATQGRLDGVHVIVVTCAEHFAGGALTTAVFALMMARVDRSIGASHYAVLAAVEVLGKWPAALISGALADATSYRVVFAVGWWLSAFFLLALLPLRQRDRARSEVGAAGHGEGSETEGRAIQLDRSSSDGRKIPMS